MMLRYYKTTQLPLEFRARSGNFVRACVRTFQIKIVGKFVLLNLDFYCNILMPSVLKIALQDLS